MSADNEGGSGRDGRLGRALGWLLDDEADWVLGDLEERRRKRRGALRHLRWLSDLASVTGWALLRRTVGGKGRAGFVDVLRQDVRYTLTSLRRNLGFTAVVILTLAIGIGANTAVFSVVHTVLLRPLPYADPDGLVTLWTSIPERGIEEATSAYGNVQDWKEQSRTLEDLATWDPTSRTLTGAEWPEQVSTAAVSANLFSLLGVEPAIGRTFSADEERRRAAVAVLSHDLSTERFGSSAAALGERLVIDGRLVEVIGVMPEGFAYPGRDTQLWMPQTVLSGWDERVTRRGTDSWRVLGRLSAGESLESARAEMVDLAARLERAHARENAGLGVRVVPLQDQLTGYPLRLGLWTLFGAVGFVLLIACANAAHLIVARGLDRAHELSLRSALGASTPRLVRLTLTETLVLSLASGLGGLLIAAGALDMLAATAPVGTPREGDVGMSVPVLAYGIAVAVAVGLVVGVWPALRHSRRAPYGALRGGRGGSGGRLGRQRGRGALVVAQFALTIVLVFGANLLIRSFVQARGVELGFQPRGVLMANLRVESSSDRVPTYEQVVASVGALPGVAAAGLVEDLFITGAPNRSVTVEGSETAEPVVEELRIDAVAGPFLETIGATLVEGRAFTAADDGGSVPVAIINETMARRLWPGVSAVGRRFHTEDPRWIEVVGVVADMRRQGFERAPIAQAFRPFAQSPSRSMNLLVRTEAPLPGLPAAVRTTVAEIDGSVPVYQVRTVEEALDGYLSQRRFQTALLGLLSAIALVLAAVGIYGLVQYSVAQRTREIGVRIALGARFWEVVLMVLRQGLLLALVGLAAGIALALWLSRIAAGLLFEVAPSDPASLLATSVVLLIVTLVACYLPARRAGRVDPVSALRGS